MKRALIVGGGGLKGAFSAGVCAELCRSLGAEYFDRVYASSVGVYEASYFIANQPDTIESVWREHVDGNKLVDYLNPLRGEAILDLEYLEDMFKRGKFFLNLEKIKESDTSLTFVLTNYETGEYEFLEPDSSNIFKAMSASSSFPWLHSPVEINARKYIDGALSNPIPVDKAFEEGADEIVVITTRDDVPTMDTIPDVFETYGDHLGMPETIENLVKNYKNHLVEIYTRIVEDPRIILITPAVDLPLKNSFDTDLEHINASITIGSTTGKDFVASLTDE